MIKNNVAFTGKELAGIFGAEATASLPLDGKFCGVSTDSRMIEPGNIFVALCGENFDGHDKIPDAFNGGASLSIAEKSKAGNIEAVKDMPVIWVENSLNALGSLAAFHRNRFDIPVIAVCGSNGKTTTKEITAHILGAKYKVLKTRENFNNQLGVPLMLLSIDDTYSAAVIEAGTNEPGEIYLLSEMINPTHGIITNIGKEHLELLIDLDGVEAEETMLFGKLMKNSGMPVINLDDERLAKYSLILPRAFTFGRSAKADLRFEPEFDEMLRPTLKLISGNESIGVKMKTQGYTTALNAAAAGAVGLAVGLSLDEIAVRLESYEAPPVKSYARMTVEEIAGIKLINDCYNANPSSMEAAVMTLSGIKTHGRKFAVLGDMRELGDSSAEEHLALLKGAVERADFVFCTGTEMKKAFDKLLGEGKLRHFESKSEAASALIKALKADDAVLVKGSRGMKMEELIGALKEHFLS